MCIYIWDRYLVMSQYSDDNCGNANLIHSESIGLNQCYPANQWDSLYVMVSLTASNTPVAMYFVDFACKKPADKVTPKPLFAIAYI